MREWDRADNLMPGDLHCSEGGIMRDPLPDSATWKKTRLHYGNFERYLACWNSGECRELTAGDC